MRHIPPPLFLLAAALLEAGGDALLRKALWDVVGPARILLFLAGAVVLFAYGTVINLAPLEFGEVIGLYIATLFVMWQVMNFLFFQTAPTLPILAGGALIVLGGLIVSLWKAA
jgi:small multidrug resistance family-3 protein